MPGVVRLGPRADVRHLGRVAIRNRVAPQRQPLHQCLTAARTQHDDVVLRAQVCGVANRLRIDVVVGNLVDVERLTPPALGLSRRPAVQDGDPGGAGRVRSHRGRGRDRMGLEAELLRCVVQVGSRDVADHERAARELRAAGFERFLGNLDVRVLEPIAQGDQRVVRVVIDREHAAFPGDAAGRRHFSLDRLHRHVEHLHVGDAHGLHSEALGKRPAGVICTAGTARRSAPRT